jgi:hypothetical protein
MLIPKKETVESELILLLLNFMTEYKDTTTALMHCKLHMVWFKWDAGTDSFPLLA